MRQQVHGFRSRAAQQLRGSRLMLLCGTLESARRQRRKIPFAQPRCCASAGSGALRSTLWGDADVRPEMRDAG